MAELRASIIGEFKGKKAFSDAGKATNALDKGVKKLGATLAGVFGAQQLLRFAKNASKAFIEDQKAVTQLTQSVKNLGLAFDLPVINGFVDKLSLAAGVADDVLRPSLQKLLQVTGSVSKSQELLIQALDISRGSGVELETVVQDLSAAYVGNTRGLRKYNLGLTQAELKTLKFEDAQAKLAKTFSGANAAYLETYAGKLEVLGVAAGEAQEIIGQGLIDSLMILSGDTTVQELADTMLELANNTAEALGNLAKFGKGVQDTFGPIATVLEKFINATQPIFNSIVFGDPLFGNTRPRATARRFFAGGQDSVKEATIQKQRAAADKKSADNLKRLAALQAKTLADQKKKNALDKAARTLNLDAIGIEAALKGKISETDRLSLNLQKALLEGNATLASTLSAQLEAAIKRQKELEELLKNMPKARNPFEDWKIPSLDFGGNILGTPVPNFIPPSFVTPDMFTPDSGMGPKAYVPPAPVVDVKVEVAGEAVAAIITQQQTNDSLSGSFNTVNRTNRFAAAGFIPA
jgi:hypothetical protein